MAKINMYNTTSAIAEAVFNRIMGACPNFGIAPVSAMLNGSIVEVDQNLPLLAGALAHIMAQQGSSNAWLHPTMCSTLEYDVEMPIIERLSTFLVSEGVLENRSEQRKVVSSNGVIYETKIWPITSDLRDAVKLAIEETPEAFAPRDERVLIDGDRAKGRSSGSEKSNHAMELLDETALRFHPNTLQLAALYDKSIDRKSIEAKINPRTQIETSKTEQIEAKLAEKSAVVEAYKSRKNKPFYLTHTNDFRGRGYARGGYISTQGSKLQKACIQFSEPEMATEMDEIYIYLGRLAGSKGYKIDAAALGKLEWANPTTLEGRAVVADPARAIVRLDGCCNGIQWISSLLNNEVGMKLTNLTGDEINDLYTYTKDSLMLKDRDAAKKFIMPLAYGAGVRSLADGLGVTLEEAYKLLDQVDKILPINEYLDHIKREAEGSEASEFRWVMPDGFEVVQDYKEYDLIHAGKFSMKVFDTVRGDGRKMIAALAPNIIHSIDAYHMRLVVANSPFEVVPIHDSFGCHSSNVKALRSIIQDTFKQILCEDVLNSIMEQLGFETFEAPADPDVITNNYMFM